MLIGGDNISYDVITLARVFLYLRFVLIAEI